MTPAPRSLRQFRVVSGVVAVSAALVATLALSARLTPAQTSSGSQTAQRPTTPAPAGATHAAGDVTRGEYLVNSVAMCVQCHSPRDARGNIIANQKLRGASIPVRGPSWDSEWAYKAPALAGLPGFTDEQIVMLLTEGHAGDRPAPQRPMPPFRMNKQDAEAIVSYLRSR
jgi:mono/diheme cytochrome c family protein